MEHPEAYLGRLKPIFIFRGLSDEDLLQVAQELEVEHYKAGDVIFTEGDEGQHFYILHTGQVRVLRQRGSRPPEQVATLVPGDFFGEGALLYGRRRSATIEALTDVTVLSLSKENFDDLVRRFPHIKPNLLVSSESHLLYRRHRFNWLGADEVVYVIARRHWVVLAQWLFWPVLVGGLIALAAVWLAVTLELLWIAWVGALLELPVALWMLWVRVDWANDFYIVTNQRLVHLEKIVLIYDSRIEAPLSSIMSVNVQTDDAIQRLVNMGDIVVRTFSGPIVLKNVAMPNAVKAAIEEHWHRTRTREQEAEREQIRRTIRSRLDGGPAPQTARPAAPTRSPQAEPAGPLNQLLHFFSLRVRYEEGGNVIYRKHWFMLLRHIWQPSLGLLALLVLITLAAGGVLPAVPPSLLIAGGLLGFVPLAAWWLYGYVDWKNDIYMVTADQIFDITKKPLGAETKKSAPLGNILSLRYERPGFIGLVLNFGTVVALVAGAEFRFEGVFDPIGVQNDVYRRMEAYEHRRRQAEAAKRREEMALWITEYHKLHTDANAAEAAPSTEPLAGDLPPPEPERKPRRPDLDEPQGDWW